MTTFKDLTDQQKQNYEKSLRQVGLEPGSVPKSLVVETECQFSGDAARSHLKPHRVVVRDVAHMKELAGITNDLFTYGGSSDSHIYYPPALSPERARVLSVAARDRDALAAAMTDEERSAVGSAYHAYVTGNSDKVPDSYLSLINATSFPLEGNVFAADDVTISTPTYFTGTQPQKLVAGTLTIVKPNGQIIAECPLTIDAQFVVVKNG